MNETTIFNRFKPFLRRLAFWRNKQRTEEQRGEIGPDHALVMAVTSPERIPRFSQLRYAMQLLSLKERRVLLGAGLVFFLSLGISAAFFIKSHTGMRPAVGGTYTEALIGQPKYINPLDALANDPDRDLVKLIYSGLFKHQGMDTVPDLAESFTWANDGKTLTVKLRRDAFFHDGQQVTTEDIQFTIESIQDPARKSPLMAQFQKLKMETQDDQTIIFTLDRPDTNFLSLLTIGILPAHLWQDLPATSARLSDLNLKPVGSGPYRVGSFTRDSQGSMHSFTLERDNRYYGQKPYIQTVVFQYYPDRRQALDAFKSGLVDSVAFINAADIEKIGSSQRLKNISLELPQVTVAFFNLKNKTLASKDVRQALALAVNRTDIVAAFNDSAVAVSGPFPFGQVDASSTASDLDKARELLTKAGWAMPQNGNIRTWVGVKKTTAPKTNTKKTTTPKTTAASPSAAATTTTATSTAITTASSTEFALEIIFPDDPDLQNAAETLKRQWSLIGARVTVESVPMEELLRRATRERTDQIVLLNIFIGPEQDLTPFWWSGDATVRSLNISGLADRNVDEALQAAKTATSTESLAAARKKLTSVLSDVLPAIFLVRPIQHYLVSNSVHGESDKLTIAEPFERLTDLVNWYTKTGWQWK